VWPPGQGFFQIDGDSPRDHPEIGSEGSAIKRSDFETLKPTPVSLDGIASGVCGAACLIDVTFAFVVNHLENPKKKKKNDDSGR